MVALKNPEKWVGRISRSYSSSISTALPTSSANAISKWNRKTFFELYETIGAQLSNSRHLNLLSKLNSVPQPLIYSGSIFVFLVTFFIAIGWTFSGSFGVKAIVKHDPRMYTRCRTIGRFDANRVLDFAPNALA